jgi:hydrogenase small subunit
MAAEVKEIPVVWYQAASCSGDSVSVLNAADPNVRNVLLDELLPGHHINLMFQMTVMAGQGEQVIKILEDARERRAGGYLLVVEGTIPTAQGGACGMLGERDGKPIPMADAVTELAQGALAGIALGTCASFGGIFAAAPNPSGSVSLMQLLEDRGVELPVINVPGCPAHPDWFLGTVAHFLLNNGFKPEELDEVGRPRMFFGELVHENCPRRPDFDAGKFARKLGDPGCLYELGCKGPTTYADCPARGFNNRTNWCIADGSPCHGCVEPEFPDRLSPLYRKITRERLSEYVIAR